MEQTIDEVKPLTEEQRRMRADEFEDHKDDLKSVKLIATNETKPLTEDQKLVRADEFEDHQDTLQNVRTNTQVQEPKYKEIIRNRQQNGKGTSGLSNVERLKAKQGSSHDGSRDS